MSDPRLAKVYEVAGKLFIRQGYAQTQVDHIVKAAGISVGAMYDLFSGKREIFQFILKCTMQPQYLEEDLNLPLGEEQFWGLEDEVKYFFAEINSQLARPLEQGCRDYPFGQMLSDAYDVIANYGLGCLLFEKNPKHCGALLPYYQDYRRKYHETLLAYVEYYLAEGSVRSLQWPELSVQLIIETMSWWGMHLKYDAFEPREDIAPEIAKAVCLDALQAAFAKG